MPTDLTETTNPKLIEGCNHETEPLLPVTTTSDDHTLTRGYDYGNTSMHEIIKRLFRDRSFLYWFIFKILFFSQVFAAGLFIPLYAAEWFGGCLEQDGITPIDDCDPDYSTYAYYATMFYSIGGLITFLVSSFMGHLTDTHGRKTFFFIAIITWLIPRFVMIFYIDFYLYFTLSLAQSINGGDFFIASKGYLADIIPNKNERIVGYGFGQSSVGVGCILGSILAVAVSSIWDDHAVFLALAVFYALLLIYTHFFIEESVAHTSPFVCAATNPFRYLAKVWKYNLIFYLSLLSLLMAIVEAGIMASLFAYIGNEFKLNRQGKSTMIYGIYAVCMSVAVIVAGILLAFLKKWYNELTIMVIAVVIKILSLCLMGAISLFPLIFRNFVVLYSSAFLYGSSFFIWPAIIGLLTKYLRDDEQGTGFGIMDSWTAVANIVAPFGFGYLYVRLDELRMQWLTFGVAILFCIASIVIIVAPLKNTLKKQRYLLNFKNNTNASLLSKEQP
eukprot:156550_1